MTSSEKPPRVRVSAMTPPDGVPAPVSPEDELSVPILVPDPLSSRRRTPTDPPRMTAQEFARQSTIDRQRLERGLDQLAHKLDIVGERIKELGENCARYDERIKSVEAERGEFASIAEFREFVTGRLADVVGKDGTNGKVGSLRARIDKQDERRWSVVMFLLGLLATAGGAVAWSASTAADLRARVRHVESDVFDLRAARRVNHPAHGAGQESQP